MRNKTNLGTVPEDLVPLVKNLMWNLERMTKAGEYVEPVYFIISREQQEIVPIVTPFESPNMKYAVANMIRKIVKQESPKADCVIFMCEAWRKEYTKKKEEEWSAAALDRKTPIADRPGRVDIISIMIETYDGTWVAEPLITGDPGVPRTLSDISFERMDFFEGDMCGYLPPKNKTEIN